MFGRRKNKFDASTAEPFKSPRALQDMSLFELASELTMCIVEQQNYLNDLATAKSIRSGPGFNLVVPLTKDFSGIQKSITDEFFRRDMELLKRASTPR
jgi:hypothetical protein